MSTEKKYACKECYTLFAGWNKECPNCHAKDSIILLSHPDLLIDINENELDADTVIKETLLSIDPTVLAKNSMPTCYDNKEILELRDFIDCLESPPASPKLLRAFLFIEDEDWTRADSYLESVLDGDPTNAFAYVGKALVDLKISNTTALIEEYDQIRGNRYFRKAEQFRNDIGDYFSQFVLALSKANCGKSPAATYYYAKHNMKTATTENGFLKAAQLFQSISGYKNSGDLSSRCFEKANDCKKAIIYAKAKELMQGGTKTEYESACILFRTIAGWKDADTQLAVCEKRIKSISHNENIIRLSEKEQLSKKDKTGSGVKPAIVATAILAAVVLAIVLLIVVIIPGGKMKKADKLAETGDYQEAYKIYMSLNDQDAKEKAKNVIDPYLTQLSTQAKIGSTVYYGSFSYTKNGIERTQPIEWIVVDKKGNDLFLVSKYCISRSEFHSSDTEITWEKSSIRKWLNDSFFNSAFSEQEQKHIMISTQKSDKNPEYATKSTSSSERVFLLSVSEVEKYFPEPESRVCGRITDKSDASTTWWWLRTPGRDYYYAAYITVGGKISLLGDKVTEPYHFIRPAMWIEVG